LVNDILDYSRLKTNVIELKLGPMDIHKVSDDVLLLSKHLIGNKDIRLINRVDKRTPKVEADEGRILVHNVMNENLPALHHYTLLYYCYSDSY